MFLYAVIAQVSALNRAEAYQGESGTTVLQRLAFVAMFLGAIYGGLLFRLAQRRRDRALGLGTLLVVSTLHALYGSRMGVLYGGALWLAAYIAAHVAMSDPRRGVDARFLVRLGTAAIVILLGLSTLTQAVRYSATQELNWFKMISNPFSFIVAFGIWFDRHGLDQISPLYGARMFRRIYEFVGIRYELQPAITVGFAESNIYTIFRDLIEDFGVAGSLCVTTLFGFIGRLSFAATIDGRIRALPWLVIVYGIAMTSFAWGLLSYTTPAVAVVGFILTFRLLPPIVEGEAAPDRADAAAVAPLESGTP
jgi:oligosaccharide repeat unit polymerase